MDLGFINEIRHKQGINQEDWRHVNKKLLIILEYVASYCEVENLPLVITSIIRPKIPGVSISNSHAEGRAFDISVNHWTKEEIDQLVSLVNVEFKDIGAISFSDNKSRAVVYEDGVTHGTAQHLHFQVRPS